MTWWVGTHFLPSAKLLIRCVKYGFTYGHTVSTRTFNHRAHELPLEAGVSREYVDYLGNR